MKKIKVSKEVAEAIESLRMSTVWTDENILLHHIQKRWQAEYYKCLNQLNIETLAKILIIGYEVEKTPEEKLLAYYRCSSFNDVTCEIVKQEAIERTLDILNIKVKGINC